MDDPDCSEERLLRTLHQFASINRLLSRYRTILRRWVLDDMARDPARDYHLLDLGAGGCDIDAWLLHRARRRHLRLRITAVDADPRVVQWAQTRHRSVPGLAIQCRDALSDPSDEPVDYLFANHFLHHLRDEDIVSLLRQWTPRVRRRIVLSDLRRSRWSYAAFSLFALAYRGSFTRSDGLLSIRKGFAPDELRDIAHVAGCAAHARIHRLLPGRLVLVLDTQAPRRR
jgi:2-polyprenyl-3-methyl-5-hydroxy-6-metoxy-1,4-benzoquinol methylase